MPAKSGYVAAVIVDGVPVVFRGARTGTYYRVLGTREDGGFLLAPIRAYDAARIAWEASRKGLDVVVEPDLVTWFWDLFSK